MLKEERKKRIKLYSVIGRNRVKAEHRRDDAAEVACGNAGMLQERNRALPHASKMEFFEQEELLPTESPHEREKKRP
jgi:hypothetical protein